MRGHMTTSIERAILLAAVVAVALPRAAAGAPPRVLLHSNQEGPLRHSNQDHGIGTTLSQDTSALPDPVSLEAAGALPSWPPEPRVSWLRGGSAPSITPLPAGAAEAARFSLHGGGPFPAPSAAPAVHAVPAPPALTVLVGAAALGARRRRRS